MKVLRICRAAVSTCAIAYAVVLCAQYPGHLDTQVPKSPTSTLRAIAVIEWTGDRSRPSATRLVPVSLFDGDHLQYGGLYLARPVPLALDSGTEYEVESSGLPQGWFDVAGARQIGDDWFGFGDWKPYLPPPPKKLHPAAYPPTVVREKPSGDDRPHFVRRDQAQPPAGTDKTKGTSPDDKSQTSTAPVDPNRPRLRRRPEAAPPSSSGARETPSSTPDPDRPRISRGKPAALKNEAKPLETTPLAMGQTVAVSDASSVGTQNFAYEWGSTADAAGVRKALEAQALALLAAAPSTSAAAPAAAAAAPPQSRTFRRRTAARRTTHKTVTPAAASPFTDLHFNAFALTSGSGATLVMTAQEAGSSRSIALIAIEDIYGKVQVLWHSITDDTHLDVTPRMTLVDAVDSRGDGRANLLFEQRNATDRRFVLYAVGAANARQVFATDPLPLHPEQRSGS